MKAKTKKTKKLTSILKNVHHAVKMAVVPHKKNDYRPHLIRKCGLVVVVLLIIGLQGFYNLATAGQVLGVESDITVASLLEKTNQARAEAGLEPLILNDKLNESATLKAQDMIDNQYWAHTSPAGIEPWKWLEDADYNYAEAGENLAKGFYSTGAVMTAWLNSPDHKANIVNSNYHDVGFAIISGEMDGKITSLIVAHYGVVAHDVVSDIKSAFSESKPNTNAIILSQFAVALQSITPAGIISLILIAIVIVVSAFAHANHHKIPKAIKHSWKRHHGLYKAVGMGALGLIVIWLYGGGQI